ncbi:hypothetical protein ABTX82_36745 [Streptomyces lavendulae]|uniref:hypothetical protein n=1 Tax=Streptomyces lavendulae TaxID=1914 RepID=UPI00332F5576
MNRHLSWLAGLCMVVVTGCAAGRETPAPPPMGRITATHAHPTPTSHAARDILLAQQFDLGGYGGGLFGCRDDLSLITHKRPADHPLVWVTSSREPLAGQSDEVRVVLGESSVLCLYGFPDDKPVIVTVKAGGRTYTTPVKPVAELSSDQGGDLFNGRPIETQNLGGGVLQSGYMQFLPPDPAREAIARAGRLELTARSGDSRSTSEVPLRWEKKGAATDAEWEHSHRIAVYGYPVGAHVPIGLYRVQRDQGGGEHAVLERRVGDVIMPAFRVAVFTVPEELFRLVGGEHAEDPAYHCLAVPGLIDCVT